MKEGDLKGMNSPQLNITSEKNVKITQDKLPKDGQFCGHMETERCQFKGVHLLISRCTPLNWHLSERYKSFSRIDTIWILKNVTTKVSKVEILSNSFSDHNPMSLVIKENPVLLHRY